MIDYGLSPYPLRWRHNELDSVSNHQPQDCLLNRLFRRRSRKTSKRRATGLCTGNSPGTGEFPAQMTSNEENVSIWWRHHYPHQFWHIVHWLLEHILQSNLNRNIIVAFNNHLKIPSSKWRPLLLTSLYSTLAAAGEAIDYTITMAPVQWGRQSTFTYSSTGTVLFHDYFSPSGEQPEQHAPLWKSNQNEIWSTLSDINALCLICIKRSVEEVKTRQISKGSFQQGPRNETLKKSQCQINDVMFGHWIIQAVALFDYRMCGFTRITFNSRNSWSKGVFYGFLIFHDFA